MRSFFTGRDWYLDHHDAIRFIKACERDHTRILGIEFFRGDENVHTPVGGTAWDELVNDLPEASWREARDLLSDGIPDGGNLVVFTTER